MLYGIPRQRQSPCEAFAVNCVISNESSQIENGSRVRLLTVTLRRDVVAWRELETLEWCAVAAAALAMLDIYFHTDRHIQPPPNNSGFRATPGWWDRPRLLERLRKRWECCIRAPWNLPQADALPTFFVSFLFLWVPKLVRMRI